MARKGFATTETSPRSTAQEPGRSWGGLEGPEGEIRSVDRITTKTSKGQNQKNLKIQGFPYLGGFRLAWTPHSRCLRGSSGPRGASATGRASDRANAAPLGAPGRVCAGASATDASGRGNVGSSSGLPALGCVGTSASGRP